MKIKHLLEGTEPKLPGAVSGIQIMTPQQFVAKSAAGEEPGPEKDVAEGNDDHIWGPQGRFAGDSKVDIGGVTMKRLAAGEKVKYDGIPVIVNSIHPNGQTCEVEDRNGKVYRGVLVRDLTRLGQGMAEGYEPGDKITWYHSNHHPEIEGTVVGWKDGHLIVKSIDPTPRNTEKTVAKYRVPKNNILSHNKQGVAEGYHNNKTIITEALIAQKLWENAGRKLMEAQLTADQINQIFQQVEQGATAAGGNRTMLGRGKDAVSAVNKAWENLKTKVQNSGPIKGVDAMYDKAAEQLKQATGGDQGVMKYVQKYRDFAKKHPVAQSLIYSALIAAAGISGAGLGGAAALGLFKLVDKLLQGEKFSSAAYAGAKTGAMAYGASKVGDLVKGQMAAKADPSMTYKPDIMTPTAGQGAGQSVDMGGSFVSAAENPGVQRLANWAVKNFDMNTYDYVPKGMNVFVYDKAGNLVQSIASDPSMRKAGIYTGQQILDVMKKSAGVNESINLSESQLYLMIGKIVERQRKLDEGIMDTIKGAAEKAVNWAKTKGTNLTTKVTADKLLQAWKKAGSPMDSLDVASIIQKAGIPSATIKQVYGSMKIPFAGEPGGGAMPQSAKRTQQATPASAPVAAPANKIAVPAQQTTIPQVAPVAKAAASTTPQGFNASNVMKMPGMEKYAKPAVAKSANSSRGPTGYASVSTTFKQPAVKPAMAEEQLDELKCWPGYTRVRGVPAGAPGSCKKKTNEEGVAEATKLPAQTRDLKGDELEAYLDRIRNQEKQKTDKYKMPYIHRSSVLGYYDESGKKYNTDAIKAALKERPKALLKKNEKMKHSDGEQEQFFNIGFAALTGIALDENTNEIIIVNTCPGAGSCKVDCFAMKGGKIQFQGPWLSDGRILTYLLNNPDGFFSQLKSEIEKEELKGKKGGYKVSIRWHDAGDFFSPEYAGLAFKLANELPNVQFYAYTKIAGVALGQKPDNFMINWSEGAHTSQEKQVKAADPNLERTKNSRIVPSNLFYDLLVKDEKKNLVKGAEGQWQVIPDKLPELKQRIAKEYGISPSSILSYTEWDQKTQGGKKETPIKYNVIITPGEPDITAKSSGVLSTLLLKH